jgi:hypothetical protein
MLPGETISLRSESHPIEFRKVEIMVLSEWRTDPANSHVRLPGVARESRE